MEGALGAITGLLGAGLSYSAQQTANVINMMNLQFQKQNAAKQLQFAQAGRQDQYGNETDFNSALNKWVMNLTPTQRAITQAGETEQYKTLTEDAMRNRQIKEQQRARGLAAAPDYARVMADWRFNQPHSEAAIRDELTNLMAGSVRAQSGKDKTNLMRMALRQNQGGTIPAIIQGVNDTAGANQADIELKARDQAQQEFASRTQQHNATDLPILSQLQQLMDMGGGGGGGGPAFNPGAALGGMQQQQAAAMQAALAKEATNVGSAYKALATSSGKSPNLAGIAKGLGGGGGGRSGGQPGYGLTDQTYSDNPEDYQSSYGDF